MLLNPLVYHNPRTLEEVLDLYGSLENVRLQAGGTFLLNALKLLKRNGAKTPEHVINLRKVEDLQGIRREKDRLIIQAMTTIDDIYNSKEATEAFPVFKSICRNISTQPIRNMATIGGNLTCRYTWTEMPAVAIGLEAALHFTHPDRTEEVLEAEDFFKNAAKTKGILTRISFPITPKAKVAYRRVKKSQFVDIPKLSLLIKTTPQDGALQQTRVAVNNCVDFAQRDTELENFLNTQSCPNPALADEALDHVTESIYDKRADDYKKHMFRISLKSALEEICA